MKSCRCQSIFPICQSTSSPPPLFNFLWLSLFLLPSLYCNWPCLRQPTSLSYVWAVPLEIHTVRRPCFCFGRHGNVSAPIRIRVACQHERCWSANCQSPPVDATEDAYMNTIPIEGCEGSLSVQSLGISTMSREITKGVGPKLGDYRFVTLDCGEFAAGPSMWMTFSVRNQATVAKSPTRLVSPQLIARL